MPKIKSARKALRQNIRRRKLNLERKKRMRGVVTKFKKLVAAGLPAEAQALLPELYKTLDKTAKTGVIKKNAASRLKSRLTKKLRSR